MRFTIFTEDVRLRFYSPHFFQIFINSARLFQEVHIGSVETPVGTGSVSGEE